VRLWLILGLVVALAGVFTIELLQGDTGHVLISFGSTAVQMSIWLALFVQVGILLFIYIVYKSVRAIFSYFGSSLSWFSSKRAYKIEHKYRMGLLHFFRGEWKASKEQLSAVKSKNLPIVRVMAAAEAELKMGDIDAAIFRLRDAEKRFPEEQLWLGGMLLKMLIDLGRYSEAGLVYSDLARKSPSDSFIAEKGLRVLIGQGKWLEAISTLEGLRSKRILTKPQVELISIDLQQKRLVALGHGADLNASVLEHAWAEVPKPLKKTLSLVEVYADLLYRVKNFVVLEELIAIQLGFNWSQTLLRLYGMIESSDMKLQMSKAERWLKKHEDDAVLQCVLAKLATRNQLWGKAKSYYLRSLELTESTEAYQGLADLAEEQGDMPQSLQWYKKAALNAA
jgi:HemY protein